MKAISIWQPWADLILYHGKTTENRTWWNRYRGNLLVHASKKVDEEAYYHYRARFSLPDSPYAMTQGALVGCVFLYAIDTEFLTEWDNPDCQHWRLSHPRVFETPIPYRGAQGLFDVPDDFIAHALRTARAGGPDVRRPVNVEEPLVVEPERQPDMFGN